jgi:hypothetical protein
VQFYGGYPDLSGGLDYVAIILNGYPANHIVAVILTNSDDGGGFVDLTTGQTTVQALLPSYSDFGGVGGFEYFNALPSGTNAPERWTEFFYKAMNS